MSDFRDTGSNTQKTGKQKPRILLVGYNGANNTGSEARLISILEDIYEVFGRDISITIPTFNIKNLKRYVEESYSLKIISVPSIYIFSLNKLIRNHDIIILVEGSCYMDTWTTALLRAFLTSTKLAASMHKPIIAYAVDVGELSSTNLKLLKKEADKTDFILTRSRTAADTLKKWGITAPIQHTADCAFSFFPGNNDSSFLNSQWPEASKKLLVGFALVNYFLWPVVIKLFGKKKNSYRWPYYFSTSKERTARTEQFVSGFAKEIEKIIEKFDCYIPLICMEQLDESFAEKIFGSVSYEKRKRIKIFSSGKYNASRMTGLLRSLNLLVTSRYHGCVLAMQAGIPIIAIGHDLRLKVLFHEIGLIDEMFIDYRDPDLFSRLEILIDRILKKLEKDDESDFVTGIKEHILNSYEDLYMRSKQNRQFLKSFARRYGWI
jgi:polysaccharide pyruvyl transferase WcaK-like protein